MITVTVDNSKCPNSRWYSGSGIYRPVWMYLAGDKYITRNGIKTALSYQPVVVQVDVAVNGGEALVELLDGDRVLVSGVPGTFQLENLELWDENTPKLYT